MTDVVTVDQFLPHPPDRVWRAISDPAALSAWFMVTDFAPEVGHEFTFTRRQDNPAAHFGARIAGRVLTVEPGKLLRYTWTEEDYPADYDTVVTWTLLAEGRGTRILLEHRGFASDEVQQLGRGLIAGGWPRHLAERLAPYLRDTVPAV
jgi:uncharacterized protein YndB with AHSA1/START domain